MNVRLKKGFHFSAAYYIAETFIVNDYTLDIDFITLTDSPVNQNIALARIKYWIFDVLESSCMISSHDTKAIRKFQSLNITTLALPEEPWDQIVGMMIFSKLQAITYPHIRVQQVGIHSSAGDNITYLHADNESLGPFLDEAAWWMRSDPNYSDQVTRKGNIVDLPKLETWASLELDWISDQESVDNNDKLSNTNDSAGTIVYGQFTRDED